MNVYVVVGVYRGVIEDTRVFIDKNKANLFKKKIEMEYGSKDDNDVDIIYTAVEE